MNDIPEINGQDRWVIMHSVKSGIQVAKVPAEQHAAYPVGAHGVFTDFQEACERAALKCLEKSQFYITQGQHWNTMSKKTRLVGVNQAEAPAAPAGETETKKEEGHDGTQSDNQNQQG